MKGIWNQHRLQWQIKIITDHPNEMQQEKARQRKHSIDHIYEYQPVFQLHRPSCREPTQLSFVFQ